MSFCAIALAGCGCTTCDRIVSRTANGKASTGLKFRTPIPVPSRASLSPEPVRTPTSESAGALLRPQLEPDCEFKTGDSNFDERQKLDYERQCYRHAEMIVRNRLELLQSSVNTTIAANGKASKGLKVRTPTPESAGALLSPLPEPDCELKTGDSTFSERQKLDYERQCYRHAEMIVRNRLELLQSFGR